MRKIVCLFISIVVLLSGCGSSSQGAGTVSSSSHAYALFGQPSKLSVNGVDCSEDDFLEYLSSIPSGSYSNASWDGEDFFFPLSIYSFEECELNI